MGQEAVNIPLVAPRGWLAVEATRQLGLALRTMRRRLSEAASDDGLTETDVLVLWVVLRYQTDGVDQRQLAEAVGVSTAQVSGVVERLSKAGLIVSERPEADRRRQTWRLSPAGRAALDRIAGILSDGISEHDELGYAELTRLLSLLGRLYDRQRLRIVGTLGGALGGEEGSR